MLAKFAGTAEAGGPAAVGLAMPCSSDVERAGCGSGRFAPLIDPWLDAGTEGGPIAPDWGVCGAYGSVTGGMAYCCGTFAGV